MQNKYRLRANQYDRETEDEKIRPYRIYYIAVEGNATEKEYFEGLSAYRENLGIHGIVSVEVLQRSSKDGHSAPKQVLELLEEYISLRNNGIANELSDDDFSSMHEESISMAFWLTHLIRLRRRRLVSQKGWICQGVAPRDGGNYIAQAIRYATGVDLAECFVKAAMGEPIDLPAQVQPEEYWAYYAVHSLKDGI